MTPRFLNARTGRLEALDAAGRRVGLAWDRSSPRAGAVAAVLERSLRYLGLEPEAAPAASAALFCGEKEPAGKALWLKVGPLRGAADADALRWLCATTRYGEAIDASAAALESARAERVWLAREAAAADLGGAANQAGLAGYRARFRDALADDLDLPAALCALRDGLRPGALSPGSRQALVAEAVPILGLDAFRIASH